MTLGYCTVCHKLVAILQGERVHPDTRARVWYPVVHDAPNGGPCKGARKGIK